MPALSLSLLLAITAPGPTPPDPGVPPSTATSPSADPSVEAPEPASEPASEPAPEPAPASAPAASPPLVYAPEPIAPQPQRKPPPERGPFFSGEPASETHSPNGPRAGDPPRFSVGHGAFCFVDDSFCKISLIATADIGVGVNLAGGTRTPDLPYAQFNFRGGLAFKPLMFGRQDTWHPWGIGLLGSWSRGTGPSRSSGEKVALHTDTWRVLLVNQLWLSKKRNGFHLDLDLGLIRSTVLGSVKQFWGSNAALSVNWGGWGGIFMSGDFLDHDTRIVFGFRGHGMVTAPAIGLVLLGLLAGGALGGGQ